jgi:hypothetical protein
LKDHRTHANARPEPVRPEIVDSLKLELLVDVSPNRRLGRREERIGQDQADTAAIAEKSDAERNEQLPRVPWVVRVETQPFG